MHQSKIIHPPKGKTVDTSHPSRDDYLFGMCHLFVSFLECIKTIRVDEEGSLAQNTKYTSFLITDCITLDTTGGYSSFLMEK
jgi:hypothetical protein